MTKMITEEDMSLDCLNSHMQDSGLDICSIDREDEHILIHTESGIGYTVLLLEDKKFIRITTTLPLKRETPREQRLDFANSLNDDVFLPTFTINRRGDLRVNYVMTYRHGLIAGQFMSIVLRFGSMLEYVVNTKNVDGLIDFAAMSDESEDTPDLSSIQTTSRCLLN